MAKEKSQRVPSVSFENSLQELEQIVAKLESGELPLEDALNEFERGIQIAKQGQKVLQLKPSSVSKSCCVMMKTIRKRLLTLNHLQIFLLIPNKLCLNKRIYHLSNYSNRLKFVWIAFCYPY